MTGFLVWGSKPSRLQFVGYTIKLTEDEDDVGHALRSSGLLRLKASRDRISQYDLKIDGGAARMVHVASSRRLRQVEAKDGWRDAIGCIELVTSRCQIHIIIC
jgi:hypothetical protein